MRLLLPLICALIAIAVFAGFDMGSLSYQWPRWTALAVFVLSLGGWANAQR